MTQKLRTIRHLFYLTFSDKDSLRSWPFAVAPHTRQKNVKFVPARARVMHAMDTEPVQGLTIDSAAAASGDYIVTPSGRLHRSGPRCSRPACPILSPLLTMHKFPSERGFRILIRICL